MLLHHAHRALASLRGKLGGLVHGSILSGVGASTEPGAFKPLRVVVAQVAAQTCLQVRAHRANPRVRRISKRQDPLKHRMEHSRFVTDDIFRLCARTFQRRSGNAPDLTNQDFSMFGALSAPEN